MPRTKSAIPRPSAEQLRALYIEQQLGCPEIGCMFERDASTVRNWLLQAGIPTRPRGSDVRQHFKPGQRSAFSGRTHSAETRLKIGAKSKGRELPRGDDHWLRKVPPEQNPNWKGGATPERQAFYRSPEWKAACRAVWMRADACCERCRLNWRTVDRKTTPTFHVHHVWSFQIRETRANPALLVLLCRPCHLFVHSKANVTREFLPQDPEEVGHFPSLAFFNAMSEQELREWSDAAMGRHLRAMEAYRATGFIAVTATA